MIPKREMKDFYHSVSAERLLHKMRQFRVAIRNGTVGSLLLRYFMTRLLGYGEQNVS